MDKTQKSLLDTYFRKRNIVVKGDVYDSFKKNEIDYILSNEDKFNIDDFTFNGNPAVNNAIKNPNKYYLDFVSTKGSYLADLLVLQPHLIDKLDLTKLTGNYIVFVLSKQPSLVDKLNLNDLDQYDIRDILKEQPQLYNKFDVSKLSGTNISDVIYWNPYLIEYFKRDGLLNKLNSYNIVHLLHRHPELDSYFK